MPKDAFIFGVSQGLQRPEIPADISLEACGLATHFMSLRYTTGQVVLDNDVRRQAWKYKDRADPRDAQRTPEELDMKYLLSACPGHNLTIPLVAWFASTRYHGLSSRDRATFEAAYTKLLNLFRKMEEFNLGEVSGEGRALAFQKRHVDSLSTFARDLVRETWRLPLWIFGAHLPGPRPPATATAPTPTMATSAPSQASEHGAPEEPPPAMPQSQNAATSAPAAPSGVTTPVGDGKSSNPPRASADPPKAPGRRNSASADLDSKEPKEKRQRCAWGSGTNFYPRTPASEHIRNALDAAAYVRKLFLERGVRVRVDPKGSEASYYKFHGTCRETSACPVTYQIRVYFENEGSVAIEAFHEPHQHGNESFGFGNLFTAAEQRVAESYKANALAGQLTKTGLLQALRAAGFNSLDSKAGKAKIKQWIMRENAKARKAEGIIPARAGPPRVIEMEVNFENLRLRHLADLDVTDFDSDLRVLPNATITSSRGYVPFTCRGMASLLRTAENEEFFLAVDAKVGKGPRAWRIITIGFLGKTGLHRSNIKRLKGFARVQGLAYTTSFKPVFQALVHEETTENYVAVFNLFLDVGSHILGISRAHFKDSIIRIGKDFNPAIEAARVTVLDTARPCGDTTH